MLPQARGDAEWLTGKDVVAGIADGSVEGYYQLQQEMMVNSGAITAEEQRPVSEYVDMELMTEAGSY